MTKLSISQTKRAVMAGLVMALMALPTSAFAQAAGGDDGADSGNGRDTQPLQIYGGCEGSGPRCDDPVVPVASESDCSCTTQKVQTKNGIVKVSNCSYTRNGATHICYRK